MVFLCRSGPVGHVVHPPSTSTHLVCLYFFYLYIYIWLSTTSQSKEHLVPLGPAVTTLRESHIKASSMQPTEKRGEQRGRKKKRENLGQILFHTHHESVFTHGKFAAVLHVNPSVSETWLVPSLRVWLWLPRSSFHCCKGSGNMFAIITTLNVVLALHHFYTIMSTV